MHKVLRASQLCLGILLMLLSACAGGHAKPPLKTMLQTAMPADPFANDGLSFRALCYHDARDHLRDTWRDWPEATAVDTSDLIQQFAWLRENGYHVVSLDAILAARNGGPPLPPKAVLLTFDDGYVSMYTRVFPLLKLFGYPAVLGLVGEWMEDLQDGKVFYGDRWLPREQFVTWTHVQEMLASGLVEVASHSYSLHKGLLSNPQGSAPPAARTRFYDGATGSYESDAAYSTRIYQDLVRSSAVIERHTGRKPRVMVWPYGAYTMPGVEAAQAAGMPITMTLEHGPNTPTHPLSRLRRRLVYFDYSIADFKQALHEPAALDGEEMPRQRVVHVALDTVYDADPAQQEKNLGQLIDRLARLQVNTVYLQAFADVDGNRAAEALYFPNRHLPMRADLFNRVAWQLRVRTGVDVYAWLPVLAFELPRDHPAATLTEAVAADAPASARQGGAVRLSPFAASARHTIQDIYEDLAKNAPVLGLLLDDDATCNDYEDASPAALQVYQDVWGLSGSLAMIHADNRMQHSWRQRKSAYLTHFTLQLVARAQRYQPAILTARRIDAQAVLEPATAACTAQSLADYLQTYDFVVVTTRLTMENAASPAHQLPQLVDNIAQTPAALYRTVLALPSRDERTQHPIPSAYLAAQLQVLQRHGARNFGYYLDDFQQDHPAFSVIKPAMSLATNPGRYPYDQTPQ